MKTRLTEEDLEQIFISSRFKKRNPLVIFFKFFGLFVLFFAIIFLALNFSAYKQKITFWYHDEFLAENSNSISSVISTGDIQTLETQNKIPNISDNSIYIENINIKAPITFRVPNNENDVSASLKNGLIQLDGTALPGEVGNVFITGHSSNYLWVKSDYNAIFALLSKVVIGDAILVKFQNQNYIYQVKNIFITSSSDVSVMNPQNNQSILTLMTCTPVGTNLKRLIVRAEQIYPDPFMNRKTFSSSKNKNLPEGVR